jgi:cytochrome c biogenesis protein ResB
LGSAILSFFRSDHFLVRWLTSVKLTVILLVLIGLACIVGTLIPQANMVGASPDVLFRMYTDWYGLIFHRIFNALSLYHLFSSWWFSVLLILLTINMVFCSLNRWRWRWRQLGFQLTHLSIIFLLVGVVIGLNRSEGMLQVFEGDSSNTMILGWNPRVPNSPAEAREIAEEMVSQNGMTTATLPFTIHLDDFRVARHKQPLDRIRFQAARRTEGGQVVESRIVSFNIEHQKYFWRPAGEPWTIEVLATSPVMRATMEVVESGDPSSAPAIEVSVLARGTESRRWLMTERQKRLPLLPDLTLEYQAAGDDAAWKRLLAQDDLATTGAPDQVAVALGDGTVNLPVRIGEEQAVPGTDLTVTVLRLLPDFRVGEGRRFFSASQERNNPAIEVRVKSGARVETQWLFARMPDFNPPLQIGDQTISLRFLEGDPQTPHYVRIVDGSTSGKRQLQYYMDGRLLKSQPVETGEAMALPDGTEIRIDRWIEHASMARRQEPDPTAVAARLRIRDLRTGEEDETVLRSGASEQRGQLFFMVTREFPIEQFISDVEVLEDGREVLKKRIQMNDPLRYGGYTLYQSSYDSEAGDASRYTVLSVKRDPGVLFIYIGFSILTVGLVIVFYVNPFLRKRKRTNGEVEEEEL